MSEQAIIMTGKIEACNDTGVKVSGQWYNYSKYMDGDKIPALKNDDEITMDVRKKWIQRIELMPGGRVPEKEEKPSHTGIVKAKQGKKLAIEYGGKTESFFLTVKTQIDDGKEPEQGDAVKFRFHAGQDGSQFVNRIKVLAERQPLESNGSTPEEPEFLKEEAQSRYSPPVSYAAKTTDKDVLIARQTCIKAAAELYGGTGAGYAEVIECAGYFLEWVLRKE